MIYWGQDFNAAELNTDDKERRMYRLTAVNRRKQQSWQEKQSAEQWECRKWRAGQEQKAKPREIMGDNKPSLSSKCGSYCATPFQVCSLCSYSSRRRHYYLPQTSPIYFQKKIILN